MPFPHVRKDTDDELLEKSVGGRPSETSPRGEVSNVALPDRPTELLRRRFIADAINAGGVIRRLLRAAPSAPLF